MKLKNYLMLAAGLLFSSFAVNYVIRFPEALRYAHSDHPTSPFTGSSVIIVVCANIIIWGGFGFGLIWLAFKWKDKP
jgi:multisubunit Na+/H+ antiporter MnhG subunit